MSLDERFDVRATIHIGQTASAYEAIQRGLDRKVLLKVIHPQWKNDPELIERFKREGKAAARVSHQNVVKIFDIGWDDGLPFIVLEWIDGGTLADRLRDGPLPQEAVKKIAVELLKGLSAVHRAHLLHRDIKPDNIMLGVDGEARLTDFSLAGLGVHSTLTGHDGIVGSPAYLAPELLKNSSPDVRSDLYSLGLTLLEALTGSNPYKSDDPVAAITLVLSTDPPRLKGRNRIDTSLAILIDALLERDPTRRPISAEAALLLLTGQTEFIAPQTIPETRSTPRLQIIRFAIIGVVFITVLLLLLTVGNASRYLAPKAKFPHPILENHYQTQADIMEDEKSSHTMVAESNNIDTTFQQVLQTESVSNGYSVLIVRPWGNVFIDGSPFGASPVAPVELTPGEHHLTVTHPQLPEIHRSFRIEPGEKDTLMVDLLMETASVFITAIPWGYLTIDGDSLGLLPRSDPVWLTAGRHSLQVKHPELGLFTEEIALKPGEQASFRIDLNSGTLIATPDNREGSQSGE